MESHRFGTSNSSYSRTITKTQSKSNTVVSVSSYESVSQASHFKSAASSFQTGDLFETMSEKRKPKRVVGRSISLNFNNAHALNLRLRRGYNLLSPLQIKHGTNAFRQVSFKCIIIILM